MKAISTIRRIQTSVTNFLYCGDQYLFLHRDSKKKVDPKRLNGIGGKVEKGENYLDAAIRETYEETGYRVSAKDMQLSGLVRLEEGYEDDWVMCFFKIKVPNMRIPLGNKTQDGELIWIHKNEILKTPYELVDDLHYCIDHIIKEKGVFFMNIQLDKKQKAQNTSISILEHVHTLRQLTNA